MIYFGWLDIRDIPLSQKVRDAMERHREKYGVPPNVLEMNLNEGDVEGLDIEVSRYNHILPYHYLFGVKDENIREVFSDENH